jgi:hypothetical protein
MAIVMIKITFFKEICNKKALSLKEQIVNKIYNNEMNNFC